MKIGAAVIVIWLLFGVIATSQRGYFARNNSSCARASTVALTVVSGPLNYVGVNPKVTCQVPQPSA